MSEDIASPKASSSKTKKQKPSALEVAGPEILAEIISLPELEHDSHRSVTLPPPRSPFAVDRSDVHLKRRRQKD